MNLNNNFYLYYLYVYIITNKTKEAIDWKDKHTKRKYKN